MYTTNLHFTHFFALSLAFQRASKPQNDILIFALSKSSIGAIF
nr:MAG TPA: hypothetical protein [Caudoviricetes sp.]